MKRTAQSINVIYLGFVLMLTIVGCGDIQNRDMADSVDSTRATHNKIVQYTAPENEADLLSDAEGIIGIWFGKCFSGNSMILEFNVNGTFVATDNAGGNGTGLYSYDGEDSMTYKTLSSNEKGCVPSRSSSGTIALNLMGNRLTLHDGPMGYFTRG